MSDEDEKDHELLAGAFRALREDATGADRGAAETRRRVLLATAGVRRRRVLVLRLVVPLAAVLAIGTAWAAASGRLAALLETGGYRPAETSDAGGASASPSAPDADANDVDANDVDAPANANASAPADACVRATAAGRLADTETAPVRVLAPPPADREEALYRAAHEAHFVARDPPRTLAAWDAYLAVYPRGRLAPEARYNRALTLVRLGRKDEARTALVPFAAAGPGGYRQAEARALLEAMQ